MTGAPNFDRIARPYRWLEYLALGPLLEQTRNHHLPRIEHCRQALVLGDGDGRFTARMLASCPAMQADAVDLSAAMLHLLQGRCMRNAQRLTAHHADARSFDPPQVPGLVVTHFFLDCLMQSEVDALVARLTRQLAPGALWLVSDFRIPEGALGWIARGYVRLLYFAFRVLTGLRTTRLPDHASALRRCGFKLLAMHRTMFGMLTTELWQR
jgi:ubiquinone/menaquinone biosynthesis C-methylase UbiE